MNFITLDQLVRDFCSTFLADEKADQYVRVARTIRVILEELHLLAIPFVQTKEFTISDSYTVALPADCIKPLQVGSMNSAGRLNVFAQDIRIRRSTKNAIDNPVDCDNPDHDQPLNVSTVQSTTPSLVFFNYSSRGGHIGELYGYRHHAGVVGTWRWNQSLGLIEFGDGTDVYSGATVIVEYKSSFGEDIHRLIPSQWQTAISYRAMQHLNAGKSPGASDAHFRQFLREYQTIKRAMAHKSPKEIHEVIESARYGSAKW